MKIKDIIKAQVAIGELIQLDRQDKLVLHSSVRIRLAGALRKTRPVVEDFQEQNNAIVTKYGTPVGEKKPGEFEVKQDSDKFPAFKKERDELLATDIELSFTPLEQADLFGKSEDADKQNQISLDTLGALIDVGLLKE